MTKQSRAFKLCLRLDTSSALITLPGPVEVWRRSRIKGKEETTANGPSWRRFICGQRLALLERQATVPPNGHELSMSSEDGWDTG